MNTSEADRVAAGKELETLEGSPQRTIAGISRERPGNVPSNIDQAELSKELVEPLKKDDTVMAFQANNTYGEFMGELEKSMNFEVVTRTNFNPKRMTDTIVNLGKNIIKMLYSYQKLLMMEQKGQDQAQKFIFKIDKALILHSL